MPTPAVVDREALDDRAGLRQVEQVRAGDGGRDLGVDLAVEEGQVDPTAGQHQPDAAGGVDRVQLGIDPDPPKFRLNLSNNALAGPRKSLH